MNAKDVIIFAELLMCISLYTTGTALTIFRTNRACKIGLRWMNGTMLANILVMLTWVMLSLGK